MTEEEDNNDDSNEGDSKPSPCKQICLASSWCVITKCNHHVHCVLAHLSCADLGQPILISDSACDQFLITRDWMVFEWTSHHVLMTGVFAGLNIGEKFPVIIGMAKLWDENGNVYAAIVNEVLYDDNKAQVESLLSVHQGLANPQNRIDHCAHCEHDVSGKPGWQKCSIRFKWGIILLWRIKMFLWDLNNNSRGDGYTSKNLYPWPIDEGICSIDMCPLLSIDSIWTIMASSTVEMSFGIYSWQGGWQNFNCNNIDGG